jgi:molybdopterin-guanine dinucleotide biosynthesis protein A
MIGVVLCGGNSTRMGTDKGLLKEGQETWAEIASNKLQAIGLPVVVSVSAEQFKSYRHVFLEEQLIIDQEDLNFKAPLSGLLSVHHFLPEEDLFVLACDIKDITISLLRKLYTGFVKDAAEAFVYTSPGMHQPLCGIYTGGGMRKISEMLRNGTLKKYSMMHVLQVLNTVYVAVSEEDLPAFNNYNSPNEL